MNRKHGNTKAFILEKATPLFAKYGYECTTIKDISQATDINVSLISYYFGGKEGLFKACIEDFGASKFELFERIIIPPKSKEELNIRLGLFLDEIIKTHTEQQDLVTLVYRELESSEQRSIDLFKRSFLNLHDLIVTFFDGAKKNKVIRSSIDPKITTLIFFGSIKSIFVNIKFKKQALNVDILNEDVSNRIKEQYLKIFCEWLLL